MRTTRYCVGVLCAGLCVLAVVFGVDQVDGLSLSRAIQRGPEVTAQTESVASTGAHGGAYLNVRFVTAGGQLVAAEVHDASSDGVSHRASLPVRYDPANPVDAEVAGQPMHTSGQARIDFASAAALAIAAIACFVAVVRDL